MALLNKTVRLFLRHGVPPHPADTVYQLSPEMRIGRGSKRDCYRHPEDQGLCIKVPRRPHRPDAQQPSIVEWYCATTLDQRGVPFVHRARCYGWVETSCGTGLVMERIRNKDGAPALTLREAARQNGLTKEQIATLFAELRRWVLTNAVPVTDLNSGNLLVRQGDDGTPYLVLVDGIGGQKVKLKFVLYRRFRWFARLLSWRRWPHLQQIAYDELAALKA